MMETLVINELEMKITKSQFQKSLQMWKGLQVNKASKKIIGYEI